MLDAVIKRVRGFQSKDGQFAESLACFIEIHQIRHIGMPLCISSKAPIVSTNTTFLNCRILLIRYYGSDSLSSENEANFYCFDLKIRIINIDYYYKSL